MEGQWDHTLDFSSKCYQIVRMELSCECEFVCSFPQPVSGANRVVSVGVALASVLEGAELKTIKRAAAIISFYEAFEEGMYPFQSSFLNKALNCKSVPLRISVI